MSDLLEVLPDFDVKPYSHLLHSLEKNDITISDLLSLDSREVVKQCPLPLSDLNTFIKDLLSKLQDELKTHSKTINTNNEIPNSITNTNANVSSNILSGDLELVTTLDPVIDEVLGGGFYPGHITEIVGESSVGKTQFVLSLLLSAQLPPPQGLQKHSIYLSTETKLNTERLHQLLESHPIYQALPSSKQPSLDHIHTLTINDLETQNHVAQYQLPIAVKRYNVGLIVIDSVAANFRAEQETNTAAGLVDRATNLNRLGLNLRRIAVDNNVVVVVTNQISDRLEDPFAPRTQGWLQSSSPSMSSSPLYEISKSSSTLSSQQDEIFNLNHQQRFFTGWGEKNEIDQESMKTPALGITWTNQISARIVLRMKRKISQENQNSSLWNDTKKNRFLAVVFAPWAKPTNCPVKYKICNQGIVSVLETQNQIRSHEGSSHDSIGIEILEDDDIEFP